MAPVNAARIQAPAGLSRVGSTAAHTRRARATALGWRVLGRRRRKGGTCWCQGGTGDDDVEGVVAVGGEGDKVSSPSTSGSAPASRFLAPVAVGIGAALFVLTRSFGGVATLSDLAEASVPLDVALSNGKPSIVEFYADWCEVCKSLAGETSRLKQQYGGSVNFVMLNVDNPKWAEEMVGYNVSGIPHWEYLDSKGESKGKLIGNLPPEVLQANAAALSGEQGNNRSLPYVREEGLASPVQDPSLGGNESSTLPRDHS